MKRGISLLFLLFCMPVFAQGINPVTPTATSMIQIQAPAFISPSNLYTTPALLGATLTSVGTLSTLAVTGAVTAGSAVANSYSSNGTLPTLTGTCAVVAGTRVGGATAGSFVIPAGNCAGTTTVIASMPTATNGWSCDAHNLNTPTSIVDQTATGAATVTFTIRTVTSNAADVVVWKCMGY